MDYQIFLAEDVWKFIDQNGIDRKNVSSVLRNLPEVGDFSELNPLDGRQLEIKVVSDYAITYFFGHAVKEIKIVDFDYAD